MESPAIAYHYTSIESAFYILGGTSPEISKKVIRLSSAESLNDRSELLDFQHSFETKIKQLFTAQELNEELTKRAIEWIKDLIAFYQDSAAFYIASFSRDNDSLSQWRAYGDDARGVAIALNIDKIQELSNAQPQNNSFGYTFKVRCKYTTTEKKETLLNLINKAKEYINRYSLSKDVTESQKFYSELVQEVCSFKNKAFAEEKEIRLVKVQIRSNKADAANCIPPPKFKVTNYGVHAFIELVISDDAVEGLVIGPKSSLNSDSKDLQYFFERANCFKLSKENISISEASYR